MVLWLEKHFSICLELVTLDQLVTGPLQMMCFACLPSPFLSDETEQEHVPQEGTEYSPANNDHLHLGYSCNKY